MSNLTLVANNYDDRPDPDGPAGAAMPKQNDDRVSYILTCLASSLLVNVVLVDHVDYFGHKVDGLYKVTRGRHMIYLDKHLKGRELHFVLAHEIAHVLLHTGKIGSSYRNDAEYRQQLEAEADAYAEELLGSIEGGKLRLPEIKSVAQGVGLC